MTDEPHLRVLSLGAGVQSTTLYLLSLDGTLPRLDAAVFSDTGWEPSAVYEHFERLRAYGEARGIPVHLVRNGNLRADTLNPQAHAAAPPFFVRNPDGSEGMTRRNCTSDYKVTPVKRKVRELLGAPIEPKPCSCLGGCTRCEGTGLLHVPGRVPAGRWAEQWIGISLDEVHRARDSDVGYARHRFPLLELKWSRRDCLRYLERVGWGTTPKSACIGCPFHGNRAWRELRDTKPDEWADAVEFDAQIRNGIAAAREGGQELAGEAFLHRSRVPLSIAPIDRVTSAEWGDRQSDLLTMLADDEAEEPDGCSPFSCRDDGR